VPDRAEGAAFFGLYYVQLIKYLSNGEFMPQLIDNFISFLIELLKISATGSYFGFRQFQKQTKLQARQQHHLEQINSLREILLILPTIFLDIHYKWELPEDSPITSKQHISDLISQLNRTRSLFLADPETIKIIDLIHSLIGETREFFKSTNRGSPSEIIEHIKTQVESKIKEIESKVY